MMVVFTMNLYFGGVSLSVEDSEMTALRIELMIVLFQDWVWACS